ncbi:hypothetical protein C8R45DRAFT_944366 [Mycena sanguinolenta]|nr:hypothetical protein C8R45DRAFT_944366 [Mycena sanguinolenta]
MNRSPRASGGWTRITGGSRKKGREGANPQSVAAAKPNERGSRRQRVSTQAHSPMSAKRSTPSRRRRELEGRRDEKRKWERRDEKRKWENENREPNPPVRGRPWVRVRTELGRRISKKGCGDNIRTYIAAIYSVPLLPTCHPPPFPARHSSTRRPTSLDSPRLPPYALSTCDWASGEDPMQRDAKARMTQVGVDAGKAKARRKEQKGDGLAHGRGREGVRKAPLPRRSQLADTSRVEREGDAVRKALRRIKTVGIQQGSRCWTANAAIEAWSSSS